MIIPAVYRFPAVLVAGISKGLYFNVVACTATGLFRWKAAFSNLHGPLEPFRSVFKETRVTGNSTSVLARNLYLHLEYVTNNFLRPTGTRSLVLSIGHSIISEESSLIDRSANASISPHPEVNRSTCCWLPRTKSAICSLASIQLRCRRWGLLFPLPNSSVFLLPL